MERKKRSKGSVWEFCYANKIFGTFGFEIKACGQKLVKFCAHTHTHTHTTAAKLVVRITESWANKDITDAKLGLEGYVMFRKDRMGRRGGGVLLYVKDTITAYEIQLREEADWEEAIWCKLVTGHKTVTMGVVYRCPNITKESNEKIQNAIREVSKGDCKIL